MKTTLKLLPMIIIILSMGQAHSQTEVASKDEQIKTAMLAAPEGVRSEAHIYGYDDNGDFVTLRNGTNHFICIADNPKNPGFEVVSYHKDLDPFMARGRALRLEGKSFQERSETREAEAKSGKLKMPSKPATLHIYAGKAVQYDSGSNTLKGASYRYVVYIPFATQESTGLSLKPNGPGHPWLMDPGKHNAHIMISPPANKDN